MLGGPPVRPVGSTLAIRVPKGPKSLTRGPPLPRHYHHPPAVPAGSNIGSKLLGTDDQSMPRLHNPSAAPEGLVPSPGP